MHDTEAWIAAELDRAESQRARRALTVFESAGAHIALGGRTLLNFSSNDYLGLARHPDVVAGAAEALRRFGAGATASRLVCGTLRCHADLESELALFKGYPAALAFSSGYAANVGAISAVVGRNDIVFADKLAHASLVDGAVLSRAKVRRFRHNDASHLERLLRDAAQSSRKLVVTESVFSMDGDLAPLAELAEVARRHGAMLLVDEAHAIGVFGEHGEGLVGLHGLQGSIQLLVGTLSKALGAGGGFVACSAAMREWLINKARSFVYSTALTPAAAGAAAAAVRLLRGRNHPGADVLAAAAAFRDRLRAAGLDVGASASQIVPVVIGGNEQALRISERLLADGILVPAIRPPTVPANSARLRFSFTGGHSRQEADIAAERVICAARAEGVA